MSNAPPPYVTYGQDPQQMPQQVHIVHQPGIINLLITFAITYLLDFVSSHGNCAINSASWPGTNVNALSKLSRDNHHQGQSSDFRKDSLVGDWAVSYNVREWKIISDVIDLHNFKLEFLLIIDLL